MKRLIKQENNAGGINGQLVTHAYAHWLADVHIGGSAPAFTCFAVRQRIRPQTARAHSLGRYGQCKKKDRQTNY